MTLFCGNLTRGREQRASRSVGPGIEPVNHWKRTLRFALAGSIAAISPLLLACDSPPEDAPAAQTPSDPAGKPPVEKAELTEADLEKLYGRWRDRFYEEPNLAKSTQWPTLQADLQRVSNEASDVHLRANAALLLGVMHEAREERPRAIAYYRHAAKLVPGDAGPHMALAVALAADKEFAEAARVQKTATKLDPDNLENWLALGELLIKSGDQEGGAKAYVDYERRRKGLIDGLTLKRKDGKYLIPVNERVACAEALGSANDEGTALALLYALKSDEDAGVRETVARMMGVQRFEVYKPALEAHLKLEKDESVRTAVAWALTEIGRDPVKPNRGLAPAPPAGDAAAEGGVADGAQAKAPTESATPANIAPPKPAPPAP